RALVDDVTPLAERDAERVRGSCQKCRDAGEVEGPGAFGEIVVDEMTVLSAQPKRVAAARVAQRGGEHIGGIVTRLRIVGAAPEVKATGDNHLRQPDVALDTIPNPEPGRIDLPGWIGL